MAVPFLWVFSSRTTVAFLLDSLVFSSTTTTINTLVFADPDLQSIPVFVLYRTEWMQLIQGKYMAKEGTKKGRKRCFSSPQFSLDLVTAKGAGVLGAFWRKWVTGWWVRALYKMQLIRFYPIAIALLYGLKWESIWMHSFFQVMSVRFVSVS